MSEWQPIETLPEDEYEGHPNDRRERRVLVSLNPRRYHIPVWVETPSEVLERIAGGHEYVGWMPLPAPPGEQTRNTLDPSFPNVSPTSEAQ